MAKGKVRKLAEVVNTFAPEGANDGRWFLLEHQLYEARIALQMARSQAEAISDLPENHDDRELAMAVQEILTPVYTQVLGALASVKSLLSDTEVAERIGKRGE